jgi:hypothetical protein
LGLDEALRDIRESSVAPREQKLLVLVRLA